jgi:hypothetical protein
LIKNPASFKYLAFIIGIILSLSIIFALPGVLMAEEKAATTITVSSAEGDAGQTVTVQVNINNPNGAAGCSLNIFYDAEYVEPVNVKAGAVLKNVLFTPNTAYVSKGMTAVRIVWATTRGITQDGDMCSIDFKLRKDGNSSLQVRDISLMNAEFLRLTSTTEDGNIKIGSGIKTPDIPPVVHNNSNPGSSGGSSLPVAKPIETPAQNQPNIIAAEDQFNDTQNHWARANIQKLVSRKILNGYSDGTFQPDRNISRAEFAAVLVRAMNYTLSQDTQLKFTDKDIIPSWAQSYVDAAVKAGIISGYQDGSFRADANISRAEMAVMVMRALKINIDPRTTLSFTDTANIPDWALPYVQEAVKLKIISGNPDNRFLPDNNATRAEAATMIVKMLEITE